MPPERSGNGWKRNEFLLSEALRDALAQRPVADYLDATSSVMSNRFDSGAVAGYRLHRRFSQAILRHFGLQGRAVDTEDGRGMGEVAGAFPQDFCDPLSFDQFGRIVGHSF